jgi:hypothetical protein
LCKLIVFGIKLIISGVDFSLKFFQVTLCGLELVPGDPALAVRNLGLTATQASYLG